MKILVVDDDDSLCRLIARFMEKNGIEVHTAQDALQGLDVLEREKIDLVVTDLMMPHLDGIAFTVQIRQDPRFKNLPVILITAYPNSELLEQSLRKGVAMTLGKPVDLNRLLALIRFSE